MGGAPSSAILETYMQSRQKNCNLLWKKKVMGTKVSNTLTLLKQNNGKIIVLVIGSLHTLTGTYTKPLTNE